MVAMFLHQTKLIISMNLITALIKINKPSHLYVYYKYWLFPHLFWGQAQHYEQTSDLDFSLFQTGQTWSSGRSAAASDKLSLSNNKNSVQ